jgi:glutathione reductase (NADPH)
LTRLETYAPELVVIGGGMGGISCAMRARRLGARVALVEPEALGGT